MPTINQTKLKAWRESRRAELNLPSGLAVTVQRVSLIDVAARGEVPATLTTMADELTAKGTLSVSIAEFPKYASLINIIVGACLVDPPARDPEVVKMFAFDRKNLNKDGHMGEEDYARALALLEQQEQDYRDSTLDFNEIPFEDRSAIFDWANLEASAMQSFRSQQETNVGAVASVESVEERTSGDSGAS